MPLYKTCPNCQAHLDSGETCTCHDEEQKQVRPETPALHSGATDVQLADATEVFALSY